MPAWADTAKTIAGLGRGGIDGPTYNAGNTSWQGSFVYYGQYNSSPRS